MTSFFFVYTTDYKPQKQNEKRKTQYYFWFQYRIYKCFNEVAVSF